MSNKAHEVQKHRSGCLIPLGLYLLVVTGVYFVTRPPLITEDFFNEPVSRQFSVATVRMIGSDREYGRWVLAGVATRDASDAEISFLLPEPEITIYVGDIHHASILEDHADWQLIEFNYSNTYMATSIYRAWADRVEPVSFQVTSSVGDVFLLFALTVVALSVYLLLVLVNFFRNRRLRKTVSTENP